MDPITARYIALGALLLSAIMFAYKYKLKMGAVPVTGVISRVKRRSSKGRYRYIPYVDVDDNGNIRKGMGMYSATSHNESKHMEGMDFQLQRVSMFGKVKYVTFQRYYNGPILFLAVAIVGFVYSFFM